MVITANGKMMYDDIFELYYNLFAEIGLGINSNQYLYDQDTMIELKYKDKYIKATVRPIELYSGMNDIVFDHTNYHLMATLFGYYLDKNSGRIPYISHYFEEDSSKEKTRLIVKTGNGDIITQFYYTSCLPYIEALFSLSDNQVDLSNFDILY